METSDLSLRKMSDMVGVALEQLQVTTVKYFLALSSQLFPLCEVKPIKMARGGGGAAQSTS